MEHNDPIVHLNTIHGIRHNMVMLAITDDQTADAEWRKLISVEMRLYCEGLELLSEQRYADYVEWFMNSTPPPVLDQLGEMFQTIADSLKEQQSAPSDPYGDSDIPF